jgi:two-component system sensor histidine kinase KdpD
LAVHVQPPDSVRAEEKKHLVRTLSLARSLGASVITIAGEDLIGTLLRVAREENVTQIVVGKPRGNAWREFLRGGSLADRLIRRSGDIDISVVRSEALSDRPSPSAEQAADLRSSMREAVVGLLSVAGVTGACWLVREITGYWAIALIYLSLVVFLATRLRRAVILLIAALSAVLWNFLFIPPLFTLRIGHFQDGLMFVMYFVVALVISQLTARVRFREIAERKREQRTVALYRLTQGVVESTTLDEGLRRAAQEIENAFNAQSAILLIGKNGRLTAHSQSPRMRPLDAKDKDLAAWTLRHGRPGGRFTDTSPETGLLHLPLQTGKTTVGVLIVHFGPRPPLSLDERELLETFADQIAVLIERYWLIQEAGRAQMAEESEKLYKTLFDCVSHELKTPLAVIQASADNARQVLALAKDRQDVPAFLHEIETASGRLSRIVDNLLNMTRIETGRYTLAPVWTDPDEIIASACQQVGDLLGKHRLRVIGAVDMPSVKTDSTFVEQALANLLANAAGYSPEDSQITVSARLDGNHLFLRVMDEGPGLLPEVAGHVFEKFFRGPNAPPGGVGLGLSIVRGLMQAMGGEVTTENNPNRGATFILRIPVETKRVPPSV